MSSRLPTGLVATALLRRVHDAGGSAMVRARGDAQAGTILVILEHRDQPIRVVERGVGADGRTVLIDSTPAQDVSGYWQRRRARDPDLWVIELDIADGERFAVETLLSD